MGARGLTTLAALSLGIAACDVAAPVAPPVDPQLIVFCVLDPAAGQQLVLLMQSRASTLDTVPRPVNAGDPIASTGETPVSDARVVLYGPRGDSVLAREDRVADSRAAGGARGTGVYRAGGGATAPFPVDPGEVYRLRVESPLGTAQASTRVPSAPRVVVGATRVIDIAHDTVLLDTAGVRAGGFVYELRTASGNGREGDEQFHRTADPTLVLPSSKEDWAYAYIRDRLKPGTRHTFAVTAADSNYFAYYGQTYDPFTDRSQQTSLRGAAGLFGSVLLIYSVRADIVQR